MPRASAIAREREPDTYVPFVGHAAPNVILLDDGALLAMLALDGIAWETADVDDVNARHAQRNLLLRNIASERLVLATHTVRTMADATVYPVERCRSPFAQDLDEAYRRRLFSDRLFRNELFLSVLFRAPQAPAPGLSILFGRRRRGDTRQIASTADLDRLEAIVATVEAELRAYMPRRLGLRDRAGVLFSEAGEALRLILTGEHHPVPLVNGHLGGAIYTDRVIVGREAVEIRGPGRSTYAAGFGLREYPASTWPGMFDAVLGAPYRCVLTQTFAPLGKQDAQDRMTRKQNQMVVAGDKAASQTEALAEAADLLQGNAFVMGDHHLTLVTFADSLAALADVAAQARRDLAESGAVITREDLALEAVYWAQLPGNMRLRTRPGAISSRNFAAMASLHNYPPGAPQGHWGGPLTLFRTTGGTPYRFHLHAPTETVTDLGNIFVAGPAGSGKTTLVLFLLVMAERQGAQVVFFDKDRGGEILARAVGGTYLTLPSGLPSGLAPLKALSASPQDLEFLKRLLTSLLVDEDEPLAPDVERRLEQALRQVMSAPARAPLALRGCGRFLGQSDPDGAGARLERWCAGRALGWVLDNDEDKVSPSVPVPRLRHDCGAGRRDRAWASHGVSVPPG